MSSNKTQVFSLYRKLNKAVVHILPPKDRIIGKILINEAFELKKDLTDINKINRQIERGYNTLDFINQAKDNPTGVEFKILKTIGIFKHHQLKIEHKPYPYYLKSNSIPKEVSDLKTDQYKEILQQFNDRYELALI
ncbi:hypothetical protein CONCODRAFT_4058 [Conidiobolus coronatus NRRL 28638]|uniref:Complex 1 LYR protein domain-containing protein n=1 Tax=Conidiobolus coronatus (strain ATCC 28846 / CBS 209.66 / NRRL 28638) TaxID=796925 RepID=A0A137PDN0_CONC2|nr:hypothetical protein CONCODRAFT_4058 [Conidiobolus coronatus NRRL 28638]|eukprot:KXN73041.1 hypothetical protein CONCODRAFT_4058 [Conidiobolus coronatus NRRL 28638]